jgi:hypothetical protein
MEARREELPEPFTLEIRPDRDRVVVTPLGEVDLATVDAVANEIDELVARGFRQIVTRRGLGAARPVGVLLRAACGAR